MKMNVKLIVISLLSSMQSPLDQALINANAQMLQKQNELNAARAILEDLIDQNNVAAIRDNHAHAVQKIQSLLEPLKRVARLVRVQPAEEDKQAWQEVRDNLAAANAALRAAGGVMAQISNMQGGAQMAAQALAEQAPPGITPRQQ